MKHLTILVPKVQNDVISIAAVYEIFASANAYWKEIGKKELFKIELVLSVACALGTLVPTMFKAVDLRIFASTVRFCVSEM